MNKRVEIVSIKENKILYRTNKGKMNVLVPLCIVCIIGFIMCFSFGNEEVQSVGSSMGYIYNPVNSLYSDNSTIMFTSVNMISKDNLDFVLPIISNKVELCESGDIKIVVTNSIMVKAIESGVVEDVGITLDGVKYIKVRHCYDVCSVIENVDIIGIDKNTIIKKGQDVATAKEGKVVTVKLYNNQSQISSLKINQSRIIWEK